MTDLAETLEGIDVDDHVRVTLDDGTEFAGRASPVDYVPEESLRIEVRPEDGGTDRYEITAGYDGGWSQPQVRHAEADAESGEWTELGTVESVEARDPGGDPSAGSDAS